MISPTTRLLAIAMGGSTLLFAFGCSETPQDQRDHMNDKMENVQEKMDQANEADTHQEWVEDKNAVAKDLRDLQMNIDDRLAKTEEKLADKDIKASERSKQEAMRTELKKEKDIVGAQLANVESATDGNWNTVKSDARKAMDDIKIWWDKQAEKVDEKTGSDNDHDGH